MIPNSYQSKPIKSDIHARKIWKDHIKISFKFRLSREILKIFTGYQYLIFSLLVGVLRSPIVTNQNNSKVIFILRRFERTTAEIIQVQTFQGNSDEIHRLSVWNLLDFELVVQGSPIVINQNNSKVIFILRRFERTTSENHSNSDFPGKIWWNSQVIST